MELLFDLVGGEISCLKMLDITTNVTGDKYKISSLRINFEYHDCHRSAMSNRVKLDENV